MRDRVRAMLLAILLGGGLPGGGATAADHRICAVPLSDWQPREALVAKLKAEGWVSIAIRIDDSCYKVRAVSADGEVLEAMVDPASLAIVRRGGRPHFGRHHGRGDD